VVGAGNVGRAQTHKRRVWASVTRCRGLVLKGPVIVTADAARRLRRAARQG